MTDMNSLDEPDSSGLCFNSQDDALNFARHCVENVRHRIAFNRSNFVKRYAVGALEVVLKLRIGGDNREYDFVLGAIIDRGRNMNSTTSGATNPKIHVSGEVKEWNQQPMLIAVVCLVQCPNQIIPSSVRLECAKERNYLGRNVFASSFDHIFEFSFGIGNREIGALGVARTGSDCHGIPRVVEGGSEAPEYVDGDVFEDVGDGAEFDLVDFVESITVTLDHTGAGVIFQKLIGLPFEFVNMGLCSRDAAL